MKRREYHEIYGYLPEDIINKLSENDRRRLFIEYVLRKPTSTGWFITRTVIASLGDRFINYMMENIVKALEEEGEEVTRDAIVEDLQALLEDFATDSNYLQEYIRYYRKEVLGLGDDESDEGDHAEDILKEKTCNGQKRDAKGRFVKSK